jgi:hypothetical protein
MPVLSIATNVQPAAFSQSRIVASSARVVPKVRTALRGRSCAGPLIRQATTVA